MANSFSSPYLFCHDQRVPDEIRPVGLCRDVVEAVGGLEALMRRVVHDSGGQRVVGEQVGDEARLLVHDDEAVNDRVAREEPVLEVLVAEDRGEVVLAQKLKGENIC
jgi:hypothetical protein